MVVLPPAVSVLDRIMTTAAALLFRNLNQATIRGSHAYLLHMVGCQNYGPFIGTLIIRGRIIMGTQKGP